LVEPCDELPELGGSGRKHGASQVGKPRLNHGIGKAVLISLLGLSMISAGVFMGAPMPLQ
jgi:hypothetical protein